jgi:hypothetical protein
MDQPTPFRPTEADLTRIGRDVEAIPQIQNRLIDAHPDLKVPDRVAHQYQIAGGRIELSVARQLPPELDGVGVFEAGATHIGIGRVSTGLGCPHPEGDPDFLGLRLSFRTSAGVRVDFVAINDPRTPTDTHQEFIALLHASAEGASARNALTSSVKVVQALIGRLGLAGGARVATQVTRQTLRTATSSTAYQSYWTGIAESGGVLGKLKIAPVKDENRLRRLKAGPRHLTEEWRRRQAAGPVRFDLVWLPFVGPAETSLTKLTGSWVERPVKVGEVVFPQIDGGSEAARLWAALANEMGASPGNWCGDRGDTIREPGTEFGCARKAAYRMSQEGRNALPEALYDDVFRTGEIGDTLVGELRQRRAEKARLGHVDEAP